MRAGLLRHWLTLQNPTTVPDGRGGFTPTWAALSPSPVKGSIESIPGSQRAIAGTVLAGTTHVVTMRYHSEVTTKTRILFGTRVFAVTGLANIDERSRELRVECAEVLT